MKRIIFALTLAIPFPCLGGIFGPNRVEIHHHYYNSTAPQVRYYTVAPAAPAPAVRVHVYGNSRHKTIVKVRHR